jgi:hypothetical protein
MWYWTAVPEMGVERETMISYQPIAPCYTHQLLAVTCKPTMTNFVMWRGARVGKAIALAQLSTFQAGYLSDII